MRRQDFSFERCRYQIRAFEPGRFLINDKEYRTSLIVTPHQLIEEWAVPGFAYLTAASLQEAIAFAPDVLLLGTGAEHHFLTAELQAELMAAHVGIEVMSTRAACRTFNALLLDGRHVVAALIMS